MTRSPSFPTSSGTPSPPRETAFPGRRRPKDRRRSQRSASGSLQRRCSPSTADAFATRLPQSWSLAREHEVSGIVVGFPLTLSGEAAHQAAKVKDFVRVLESRTELPVVAVDERFSTQEAERLLRSAGRRARSRDKGAVDSAAAAVILQTYLDALAAESYRSLPQSSGER